MHQPRLQWRRPRALRVWMFLGDAALRPSDSGDNKRGRVTSSSAALGGQSRGCFPHSDTCDSRLLLWGSMVRPQHATETIPPTWGRALAMVRPCGGPVMGPTVGRCLVLPPSKGQEWYANWTRASAGLVGCRPARGCRRHLQQTMADNRRRMLLAARSPSATHRGCCPQAIRCDLTLQYDSSVLPSGGI